MKKLYILVIAICMMNTANAQYYMINFLGAGAFTTVDSVKVENLTLGISLTLAGTDTLQLGIVGINETNGINNNIQVYPNPMQGQAELSFYTKQNGNAKITINDISGKQILQTENKLTQGFQKYRITGLKQGIYFINIIGEDYLYTTKLISQNLTQGNAKILYINNSKEEFIINRLSNKLKSTNAIINMPYTTGNILRFTGYSNNLSAVINDIPNCSKTITFIFTTTICPPTVTDIDGNIYNTVSIAGQCWMAKNLSVTKYNNGNNILYVPDSTWDTTPFGQYCNYNNDTNNVAIYGRLYNFRAAVDTVQNICPIGWHVPSDSEWTILINYLGGFDIAGGKLKEAGTAHWLSPNTGATNITGFAALPGGLRMSDYNHYNYLGEYGQWWSSTKSMPWDAWTYVLRYNINQIGRTFGHPAGNSIRCIHD